MRRIILGLIFSAAPLISQAHHSGVYLTCPNTVYHGFYSSESASWSACTSAAGRSCSWWEHEGVRVHAYTQYPGWNGSGTTGCNALGPNTGILHVYSYLDSCPEGTVESTELGGICQCIQGVINNETGVCETPQCQPPTTYNADTGLCQKECPIDKPWSDAARDCAPPPEPQSCSNQTGGPIQSGRQPDQFL